MLLFSSNIMQWVYLMMMDNRMFCTWSFLKKLRAPAGWFKSHTMYSKFKFLRIKKEKSVALCTDRLVTFYQCAGAAMYDLNVAKTLYIAQLNICKD